MISPVFHRYIRFWSAGEFATDLLGNLLFIGDPAAGCMHKNDVWLHHLPPWLYADEVTLWDGGIAGDVPGTLPPPDIYDLHGNPLLLFVNGWYALTRGRVEHTIGLLDNWNIVREATCSPETLELAVRAVGQIFGWLQKRQPLRYAPFHCPVPAHWGFAPTPGFLAHPYEPAMW